MSELATNAILHSASGEDGGFVVCAVHCPHDAVALWVFDLGPRPGAASGPADPPHELDDEAFCDAEHGRGLALVALNSRRYGWTRPPRHQAHSVWAEFAVPAPC